MNKTFYIKTGQPEFDDLCDYIEHFLEQDVLNMLIDGRKIRGYRSPDARSIWIRDHSDILRGAKYFETDMLSAIEHFAETQGANGRIFDYFTTSPEKLPCEKENWTKYVRVPVEADVEYRFVKGVHLAWQASGNDVWLRKMLPHMEKALHYVMNHPWRWDAKLGLVKRAYTIDTWDFAYTTDKHEWLQFQIDDNTFWGIMHGDNSGYYEAFGLMAFFYDLFKMPDRANDWRDRAEAIKSAMNNVCWNGRFYTHFVKLTAVEIPGVDEKSQLSLSNPIDINRGVTSHEQAVCILKEYQKRRKENGVFAEWYSIDPPFPDNIFGDDKLVAGAYINGGIMPLVGGELARAAFEHGFETYGVDILRRYHQLVSQSGETYLWYFPDGKASTVETSTSPDATPTDGWGSSAMLYALVEGLAGVKDEFKKYQQTLFSPRWIAANITDADVRVGYGASDSYFSYQYCQRERHVFISIESSGADINCHIMIPENSRAEAVTVSGKTVEFENERIENSRYINFVASAKNKASIIIKLIKD